MPDYWVFFVYCGTTLLTLKKTPKVPSSDAHWEPFFGKYFHPWLTIIKTTENVTDFQLNACSIKKKKKGLHHTTVKTEEPQANHTVLFSLLSSLCGIQEVSLRWGRDAGEIRWICIAVAGMIVFIIPSKTCGWLNYMAFLGGRYLYCHQDQ